MKKVNTFIFNSYNRFLLLCLLASAGIDQCKNQPKRETRQSKRSPTEIPQNLQKNKEI
jgi:hypothetical protein